MVTYICGSTSRSSSALRYTAATYFIILGKLHMVADSLNCSLMFPLFNLDVLYDVVGVIDAKLRTFNRVNSTRTDFGLVTECYHLTTSSELLQIFERRVLGYVFFPSRQGFVDNLQTDKTSAVGQKMTPWLKRQPPTCRLQREN